MNPLASPLLTDLYQLTMLQTYFSVGMRDTAVFELFVRKLPERRNFMVAAGLEQALEFLENLRFCPCDAGRHRVLSQRTDPSGHRSDARSAAR